MKQIKLCFADVGSPLRSRSWQIARLVCALVRHHVRSIERHFLCRTAQLLHVPTITSRAPIFCAFPPTPRYRPKPLPLPKRSFSEHLFTSAQRANYQPLLSPISRNDLSCARQQRRLQITRHKPILCSNNRFFWPCVSSSHSLCAHCFEIHASNGPRYQQF